MYVSYYLHVSIVGFFLFVKNEFVVGARSLNVTAGHRNDAFFWRELPIVSVSRMARHYTIQCTLSTTHTVHIELDGERQAGREGARKAGGWEGESKRRVGREGARGRE